MSHDMADAPRPNLPQVNAVQLPQVYLPVRAVLREPAGRLYYVHEKDPNGNWPAVSKGYPHSTSAFAALGRLTQKDTKEQHELPRL